MPFDSSTLVIVAICTTAQWLIFAGMRGRVQTTPGLWLPFQITDWEERACWAWRVAGIPATGHRVTPLTTNACRVTFTIPTWAPFYLPVCRAALRKLNGLAAPR